MARATELGFQVNTPNAQKEEGDSFLSGYTPQSYEDLPAQNFSGGPLIVEREMEAASPLPRQRFERPTETAPDPMAPGQYSEFAQQIDDYRKTGAYKDTATGEPKKPAFAPLPKGSLPPKIDPDAKPLTNVSAATESSKFTAKTSGVSYPRDYNIQNDTFEGSLLQNASGPVPYMFMPEFKNGIRVRQLNPMDAARISSAVKAKSIPALFDALSATTNVPYRLLTLADHVQIMYWHMLKSYPVEAFDYTWVSIYKSTGETILTKDIKDIHVEITNSDMTPQEYEHYKSKGLDVPRVMSLDIVDTLSEMEFSVEALPRSTAKEKNDYKKAREDFIILSELMQYIQCVDVLNPQVEKLIAKHGHDPIARTKGMAEFLTTQKDLTVISDIKRLLERVSQTNVKETFKATASQESMNLVAALRNLRTNANMPNKVALFDDRTKRIDSEIVRLESIYNTRKEKLQAKYASEDIGNATESDEKTFEEVADIQQKIADDIEEQLEELTFTPEEEEVMVYRNPWNFFSFVF